MKRKLAVLAVLLMFFVASAVMGKDTPSNKADSDATQLELQVRKLWEAFKNKDKATLSALLDDNFRMFEEGLTTFGDKKAEVNAPDDYELLNYTLTDFVVKPISPNGAIVTYNAQYDGKSGGEVQKGKSIFGEVWIRSDKSWKSVYMQETYVK